MLSLPEKSKVEHRLTDTLMASPEGPLRTIDCSATADHAGSQDLSDIILWTRETEQGEVGLPRAWYGQTLSHNDKAP